MSNCLSSPLFLDLYLTNGSVPRMDVGPSSKYLSVGKLIQRMTFIKFELEPRRNSSHLKDQDENW